MNPETEEKIYFYTEDLQVGYGGKQILNPVRIGIRKGEILTLVGPNGAGKSTIFKECRRAASPSGRRGLPGRRGPSGNEGNGARTADGGHVYGKGPCRVDDLPGCCGSWALSVHGAVWCPLGGGLEGS